LNEVTSRHTKRMAADACAVIEKMFSSMDADGSGSITRSEMDVCFKALDADASGRISRDEWKTAFTSVYGGTAEQADKLFIHLNKKADGEISIESFYNMFADMDADGSGDVSKEEYKQYVLKLLA